MDALDVLLSLGRFLVGRELGRNEVTAVGGVGDIVKNLQSIDCVNVFFWDDGVDVDITVVADDIVVLSVAVVIRNVGVVVLAWAFFVDGRRLRYTLVVEGKWLSTR